MIKKIKDKWAVVHCHGSNKGKAIKTFKTKKEAISMHRAIQANKKRK